MELFILYKKWENNKHETNTYLWLLKTEFSRTIFSSNSISSLGRSALMKAFTVTETSSGSCVSDNAVCTTYNRETIFSMNRLHKFSNVLLSKNPKKNIVIKLKVNFTWSISCLRYWFSRSNTLAHNSGFLLRTRYLAKLLNNEFSLQTLE